MAIWHTEPSAELYTALTRILSGLPPIENVTEFRVTGRVGYVVEVDVTTQHFAVVDDVPAPVGLSHRQRFEMRPVGDGEWSS